MLAASTTWTFGGRFQTLHLDAPVRSIERRPTDRSIAMSSSASVNRRPASSAGASVSGERRLWRHRHRSSRFVVVVRASSSSSSYETVDVDAGKFKLEREDYLFVDCRSFREYDRSHITKPPARTVNVPAADSVEDWVAACREKTRPLMKLLIVDADGSRVDAFASALVDAGYSNVVAVEGGYAAWTAKYTTFGRKVPPKGKFVSTGKEALKSGLDLDDTVAAAYEENWGKEPPKYGQEFKNGGD